MLKDLNILPLAIQLHEYETTLNQKISSFQESPSFDFLTVYTNLRSLPNHPKLHPRDNTIIPFK